MVKSRKFSSARLLSSLLFVAALLFGSNVAPVKAAPPAPAVLDGVQLNPELALAAAAALAPADAKTPATDKATPAKANAWVISSVRYDASGEWAVLVAVDQSVIDSKWETIATDSMRDLLGRRQADGSWQVTAIDPATPLDKIPADLIEPAAAQNRAVQAVSYLFPWPAGHAWYKTQGWHDGNAIDVQPVRRSNIPYDFAVLAVEAGILDQVCNDGAQVNLRVRHDDGSSTIYAHLSARNFRADLLGRRVVRGQYLGLLYSTSATGVGGWYQTGCGSGTAAHLHFHVSNRNVQINGIWANTIAGSAFATQYVSSNTRVDNGTPPPAPAVLTVREDSSFAYRGGNLAYFYHQPAGSTVANGHAYWTYTYSGLTPDNYIRYAPPTAVCGVYDLHAFIPYVNNRLADSSRAPVVIRHRAGDTRTIVNQASYATATNRWHYLGRYTFSAQANQKGQFIQISDNTGEGYPYQRSLAFDDVRLTYVGTSSACMFGSKKQPIVLEPTRPMDQVVSVTDDALTER